MKRIILTESQYKRLVRQPLNESGRGDIIFENTEDEKDVDADITWLLVYLRNQLYGLHQKNVFVKRIEGGKVYLDATKYTDKEVETINYLFSKFSEWKQGYKDQIVGLPKDLTFDIGHDTDYVFNVDTDDDDVVDTDDDDVVDTDDVANVEYDIDKTYSRGEYINLVKNIAIQQMEKYKIPASVTIAQAILESGDGNSDLAKKGKNHFGVKCHGWSGDKSYHDDDKPNECFRNYDNISDSFEDHSKFLKKNSRYDNLFRLDLNDYKGWAKGLKSAGYATSSKYAENLISIIERDNLFEYDVNNESSNDVIANVEISGGGGETNLIKPSSNYGDSRDYGWREPIPSLCRKGKTRYCNKHWHGGEDYPYPNGTEIYVLQSGKVVEKGNWTLKIKHDDGSKTRYVHCDQFFVGEGDRIESGTLIGTVGNKGPSTNPHLHFEYWEPNNNKTSNPKDIEDNYIRFKL